MNLSEHIERSRQATFDDPRSEHDLISLMLAHHRDAYEDPTYWKAAGILHYRATRDIFEAGRALLADADPNRQIVGADILGQLGIPQRAFPDETSVLLCSLLESSTDLSVLSAAISAIGHLHTTAAIPALLSHQHHSDDEVRLAVVLALSGLDDDRAIRALIELSHDRESVIRDWATFALGSQIDRDTPEIREALFARLNDDDSVVCAEALVGLARRKDQRALQPLMEMIPRTTGGTLIFEAAEEFADPRLLPMLQALPPQESEYEQSALESAISACQEKTQNLRENL